MKSAEEIANDVYVNWGINKDNACMTEGSANVFMLKNHIARAINSARMEGALWAAEIARDDNGDFYGDKICTAARKEFGG